jgi:N-acylneuraminate cytidylyltransferase
MSQGGTVGLLAGEYTGFSRRQDVPKAFVMTTVAYVSRPAFILANTGLWDGQVRAVEVPRERAVDIDSYLDFRIAEYLLAHSAREDEAL